MADQTGGLANAVVKDIVCDITQRTRGAHNMLTREIFGPLDAEAKSNIKSVNFDFLRAMSNEIDSNIKLFSKSLSSSSRQAKMMMSRSFKKAISTYAKLSEKYSVNGRDLSIQLENGLNTAEHKYFDQLQMIKPMFYNTIAQTKYDLNRVRK